MGLRWIERAHWTRRGVFSFGFHPNPNSFVHSCLVDTPIQPPQRSMVLSSTLPLLVNFPSAFIVLPVQCTGFACFHPGPSYYPSRVESSVMVHTSRWLLCPFRCLISFFFSPFLSCFSLSHCGKVDVLYALSFRFFVADSICSTRVARRRRFTIPLSSLLHYRTKRTYKMAPVLRDSYYGTCP
ncbi:hypothetical protein CPB84DRAFT_331598 [Gymnopilus junonius]|uniref:Uncharacterized protein n=1 Tax=Gymnopilus junonius TaxID=109634 RepID=A0A9P5NE46_GYMJU|nr:hypothetical protein CPB84DRAFT_331598 [Gymnopilus junonius]